MKFALVVVLSQWTDYEACKAQAVHEQAYLDQDGGGLVAECKLDTDLYSPTETLRPIARKDAD